MCNWGRRGMNRVHQDSDKAHTHPFEMTRVLTRISASITAPYPDRKFDGILTITTELSPLASPAFETGR